MIMETKVLHYSLHIWVKCNLYVYVNYLFTDIIRLLSNLLVVKGHRTWKRENPFLLKNFEKNHTYVFFDAEQHLYGRQSPSA